MLHLRDKEPLSAKNAKDANRNKKLFVEGNILYQQTPFKTSNFYSRLFAFFADSYCLVFDFIRFVGWLASHNPTLYHVYIF